MGDCYKNTMTQLIFDESYVAIIRRSLSMFSPENNIQYVNKVISKITNNKTNLKKFFKLEGFQKDKIV